MKKGLALLLLLLVCCLSSCGVKSPSVHDLESLVPDDILTYTYDGANYTSSISKFEVERQQTNEKDCIADCLITLENNNLIRKAHITMYLKYWDKGGWQLDHWEANATEEFTLYDKFDTSRFWTEIDNFGFKRDCIVEFTAAEILETYERFKANSSVSDEEKIQEEFYGITGVSPTVLSAAAQNDTGHVVALYSVEQEYANLSVFGDIIAEAYMNHSDTYPQIYTWTISLDTSSHMFFEWDITGDWYVNMAYTDAKRNIESNISITDMSTRRLLIDTNEPFYGLSGEATTLYRNEPWHLSFDPRFDWAVMKGTNLSDMHLLFEVYYGVTDAPIRVRFYPDCTYANKTTAGSILYPEPQDDDEGFLVTKKSY